ATRVKGLTFRMAWLLSSCVSSDLRRVHCLISVSHAGLDAPLRETAAPRAAAEARAPEFRLLRPIRVRGPTVPPSCASVWILISQPWFTSTGDVGARHGTAPRALPRTPS